MAILTVKVVIMPQIDQFDPANASTTFVEVIEIRDSVTGESQCKQQFQKVKLAI
jgi:hypothetical protein